MPAFRAVFRKYDKLNESVEENVRAMRVVKGFAREGYEKQKFAAASHDIAKDFTFAERVVALNAPLMQFCIYTCMIVISWLGAKAIIASGNDPALGLTTGNLTALITYTMQILSSLMMLSMVFAMLTISLSSARRIAEVLEERSDIPQPEQPVMTVRNGAVDFDHVSFVYASKADKKVLDDIDLHIRSGETIGIIGGTGASKSSLVQLIPRLYDVTGGKLTLGGVDVRDYPLEELRGKDVMVFSAIGNPSSFEQTLSSIGLNIMEAVRYPDHHDYGMLEMQYINERASSLKAVAMVTTAKDAVKIPTEFIYSAREIPLYILNMDICITEGMDKFKEYIDHAIKKELDKK